MEPNESSGLSSSYYPHLQQQQPQPPLTTTSAAAVPPTTSSSAAPSPTNGITINSSNNNNNNNNCVPNIGGASAQIVYSHALPSAVSTPLETVKRKRGRPRKYGTPEQAAAAKRLAASAVSPPKKKYQALSAGGTDGGGSSSRRSHWAVNGNAGQGFTPHIITVNAGEDVGQKVMLFMQQSKREICVLSASGSVSNVSLRQPSTSGGSITYEGQFDILSLSGSYVRTELGGRTGGLSVSLSSSDGQIIGGGIGGPLTASGPIQVIVGSFVMDSKKDVAGGLKGDAPTSTMPSPVSGTSVSGMGFRSPVDSSHQSMGGSPYIVQPPGMHMEWRGNSGHGLQQSPENGDYQHLRD